VSLEIKRKWRADGDKLIDLVNDQIFERQITGDQLAHEVGKSPAQISMILNPLHISQFTLPDLPVLMRLLDGEAIARVICRWIGRVPAIIPTGKVKAGNAIAEIGQLLTAISGAIDDGNITFKEASAIKKELLDVISSVDELVAHQVRQL
jgi:hypothetical protein